MLTWREHIELLQFFLARRGEIVERIQGLLNAQRKPDEYLHDGSLLFRLFEDCFFIGVTAAQARLRGELEQAHFAEGFRPRALTGLHNGLADPAEMMVRAFHLWQQTRWPGRNGRIHYAHALFNLYVVRCLTLLGMRIWDDGSSGAGDRLSEVQAVLDALWRGAPPDQPVLLRDARWLIPLAQSPATDDLGAYFNVVGRIAELPGRDRLAISSAGARMSGGHLRSQIRYHSTKKGVPLDEERLILSTRNSNALDFALLVQDLVPLLEAYLGACDDGDARRRIELADAICQAISPDPDLFVNFVELLGAYTMIEHLFVTGDDAQAAYTATGERHVQLVEQYKRLIGRAAKPLSEDCHHFRPTRGAYSPYGVLYGFSSDLLEHMVLKTTQPDAVTRFSLEDVFTGEEAGTGKLAWVTGWRQLPHLTPEVQRLFEYPQQFAEDVFDRIERALRTRVSEEHSPRPGRLLIGGDDAKAVSMPVLTPQKQTLGDRQEGKCLVSYETDEGWLGISKAVLTEVLAGGNDARIVGLPARATAALKLMCRGLCVE